MKEEQQNCQLIKQLNESVIILNGVANIYHGKPLQELLLAAIAHGQNIIINMAELHELDLAIMQLLVSTKITAAEHGLSLTIFPVSEQAKSLLNSSALSYELLD